MSEEGSAAPGADQDMRVTADVFVDGLTRKKDETADVVTGQRSLDEAGSRGI